MSKNASNLTGECFAPSQAGQKALEQPELQVVRSTLLWRGYGAKHSPVAGRFWKKEGPTASGTLRPLTRFSGGFSGTAAKTALGATRNRQDLSENALISEKGVLAARTRAKN